MMIRVYPIVLLIIIALPALGDEGAEKTSIFNEKWLDSVISVERMSPEQGPRSVGTGFLVRTEHNHILLITAKHIISPKGEILLDLAYRLNERGAPSVLVTNLDLEKDGLGPWFVSDTDDVACRFIAWRGTSQIVAIPQDKFLSSDKLQTGAPLLILGFPLGLRSSDHANPIVRRGIVARSDSESVVVDTFVFPGNSGGPVVYVPPIKVSGGLKSPLINEERLVGLVSNYIPYKEPAVSIHTGRPRVVFEENSGLANIVPTDAIKSLILRKDVLALDENLDNK